MGSRRPTASQPMRYIGQRKLSKSSILVVGAGGLGSPVTLYLAACGAGCLGIVDGDDVDLITFIGRINSSIKVVEHCLTLKPCNALEVVRKYDIVVGATDNLLTRYMISDCCVLLNKVWKDSPCYRCLFPNPPPVEACQRCSDSGVLGVVIGCLQALEAIKVATDVGEPLSGRMLLFDALSAHIRIPAPGLDLLPEGDRVTCKDYKRLIDDSEPHLLLDVRPANHFQNCFSLSISEYSALRVGGEKLHMVETSLKETMDASTSDKLPSLYVCERGNDSQRAVQLLCENGFISAKNIIGGLQSWAQYVDPDFPIY